MTEKDRLVAAAGRVFQEVSGLQLPEAYKVQAFAVALSKALDEEGEPVLPRVPGPARVDVAEEPLARIAEDCGCARELVEQMFKVADDGFVSLRSAGFRYSGGADAVGKAASLIVYANVVGRSVPSVPRKDVFACLRGLGLSKLSTAYSRDADRGPGIKVAAKTGYHMPTDECRQAARTILLKALGLEGAAEPQVH
jgi:hypothetical protein